MIEYCICLIIKICQVLDEWAALLKLKDELASEEDKMMKETEREKQIAHTEVLAKQVEEKRKRVKQMKELEKLELGNTSLNFDASNARAEARAAKLKSEIKSISENRRVELDNARKRKQMEDEAERRADRELARQMLQMKERSEANKRAEVSERNNRFKSVNKLLNKN